MDTIEDDARANGFTEDTDEPGDIEDEFYADATEAETEEPGTSADDIKAKIDGEPEGADASSTDEKAGEDRSMF